MTAKHDCRDLLLAELLGRCSAPHAGADSLRPILASLLAGRSLHQGVLSATLGLPEPTFQTLWRNYFSGPQLQLEDGPGQDLAELEDLRNLLLQYRARLSESEAWLAHIVACACCGRNHLWQDLGLAHRGELSTLMNTASPALAQLNTGDMKWKKFIYRYYCTKEGIYVCPAPSCGVCTDFSQCFAPED